MKKILSDEALNKISGGKMIDDFLPEIMEAIEMGQEEGCWYTKQDLIDAVHDAFADPTPHIPDDPENNIKIVLAFIDEHWK